MFVRVRVPPKPNVGLSTPVPCLTPTHAECQLVPTPQEATLAVAHSAQDAQMKVRIGACVYPKE